MRVLITGASGYVGREVALGLEKEHDLRLGGRNPPQGDPRWVRLDVTQPADVARAMQGMEAVIHLAVATGHEGDYEDDDFNQLRFDVNVKGTFNVLEAARRAGVKRFVHTSSIMVVWGSKPPETVPGDAAPRPVGTYAVTKQIAELLCEHYARSHGMSMICIRIPKPIDLADQTWKKKPDQAAMAGVSRSHSGVSQGAGCAEHRL